MKRFHLRHLVILLFYAIMFLEAIPAGVEIILSTDKKVVCSQEMLKCRITVINKTSAKICFDKHKLRNAFYFRSVYHPEEDMPYHAVIIGIHGDNFDTEPDVIVLKPDEKYSVCQLLNMEKLGKYLPVYYECTIGAGPIYRLSKTGEKKELDNQYI